jgi:hypothetical protein
VFEDNLKTKKTLSGWNALLRIAKKLLSCKTLSVKVSLNLEPIVRIQAPNNPCKIIFFVLSEIPRWGNERKGATKVLLRKKEWGQSCHISREKKK